MFNTDARHPGAFEAAARPGTATDFAGLTGRSYALLVDVPGGRQPGADAGLVRPARRRAAGHPDRGPHGTSCVRLRRDPRARVFPCDARGKPLGPGVEALGRLLDGPECAAAEAALDRHYGAPRRVFERLMTDTSDVVYLEVVPAG